MAGWLSRIAPKAKPQKEPTPYHLTCCCGREASGTRVARFKQVICRDCGEPLFVLPLNVYPEPPLEEQEAPPSVPKARKKTSTASRRKSRVERREAEPEADFVTESDGSESPKRQQQRSGVTDHASSGKKRSSDVPRRKRKRSVRNEPEATPRKRKSRTQSPAAGTPEPESELEAVPQHEPVPTDLKRVAGFGGFVRRTFTPFRLVGGCIVLVIAGTIALQFREGNVEKAQRDHKTSTELGLAAIANGDFETADKEFTRAIRAWGKLRLEDDAAARVLRQAQRETAVVVNLSGAPLFDVTEEKPPGISPGRWVVLDALAYREGLSVIVEIPFPMSGQEVALECSEGVLVDLVKEEEPKRVIFAAQAGVAREVGGSRLAVSLTADQVVLMTSSAHMRAVGLMPDDAAEVSEVNSVLNQQARVLRVQR